MSVRIETNIDSHEYQVIYEKTCGQLYLAITLIAYKKFMPVLCPVNFPLIIVENQQIYEDKRLP